MTQLNGTARTARKGCGSVKGPSDEMMDLADFKASRKGFRGNELIVFIFFILQGGRISEGNQSEASRSTRTGLSFCAKKKVDHHLPAWVCQAAVWICTFRSERLGGGWWG